MAKDENKTQTTFFIRWNRWGPSWGGVQIWKIKTPPVLSLSPILVPLAKYRLERHVNIIRKEERKKKKEIKWSIVVNPVVDPTSTCIKCLSSYNREAFILRDGLGYILTGKQLVAWQHSIKAHHIMPLSHISAARCFHVCIITLND